MSSSKTGSDTGPLILDSSSIENLLRDQMPDCEIRVVGGGGKFQVTAVGPTFAGLNAVRRQQAVYQILNEHIASGAIHAVSMQLMTPEEAAASG
jgi:acid stress-induced BolA-like protein IbaG/YrbA